MSLITLSRSPPLASRTATKPVSAEDFIQDALHYASGVVVPLAAVAGRETNDLHHEPMRRATFTLTQECIDQLQQLSEQSGLAKSKLIRLWIQRYASLNFD